MVMHHWWINLDVGHNHWIFNGWSWQRGLEEENKLPYCGLKYVYLSMTCVNICNVFTWLWIIAAVSILFTPTDFSILQVYSSVASIVCSYFVWKQGLGWKQNMNSLNQFYIFNSLLYQQEAPFICYLPFFQDNADFSWFFAIDCSFSLTNWVPYSCP